MGTKPSRINLKLFLFVFTILAAVLLFQGGAVQTVRGQTQGCDPATGLPCPTDTPGPTCGLPGLPDCASNPPPSNPPTSTSRPRPTGTPSPTATATATVTLTPTVPPMASATGAAPCVNTAEFPNASSTSLYSVTCTPIPGNNPQLGGSGGNGPTSPDSSAPVPPFLLLGVLGGIIIVCSVGLGLWARRRGFSRGMGDDPLSPPSPPISPSDQFQKADSQFQKADSQFQKADSQFQKADQQFQKADNQFQKADNQFQKADDQFQKADSQFQKADNQFQKADDIDGKAANPSFKE